MFLQNLLFVESPSILWNSSTMSEANGKPRHSRVSLDAHIAADSRLYQVLEPDCDPLHGYDTESHISLSTQRLILMKDSLRPSRYSPEGISASVKCRGF